MENLNAEQVKSDLAQFKRRIMDESVLAENVFGRDMAAIIDAIALITSQEQDKEKLGLLISELEKEKQKLFDENKRLTEEVESLKQAMEHEHASFMEIFGQYGEKCDRLTEENERLKTDLEIRNMKRASIFEIADAFDRGRIKGKADTVRKMQEMLKTGFTLHSTSLGLVVLVSDIDQIAKEMLEGV